MSTDELVSIPEAVTIPLSAEMREQLAYAVKATGKDVNQLALEFLAEELEAQVALSRGPYLRKNMYR